MIVTAESYEEAAEVAQGMGPMMPGARIEIPRRASRDALTDDPAHRHPPDRRLRRGFLGRSHFFRHEYGRLVAVLVRVAGMHVETVEDAVPSALASALTAWTAGGFPTIRAAGSIAPPTTA